MVVGHERWWQLGDQPYAMELTSQGEAVILGETHAGHHWNVTFGDTVLTNNDTYSFVAKLSADGDWLGESVRDLYGVIARPTPYMSAKMGPFTLHQTPAATETQEDDRFRELYAEPHTNGSKTYITMLAPNGSFAWLKSFNTNHTLVHYCEICDSRHRHQPPGRRLLWRCVE